MIDVHGHFFNALYLPLSGIFRSRRAPAALAILLEKTVIALAKEDPSLEEAPRADTGPIPTPMADPARAASAPGIEELSNAEAVDWLVQEVPRAALTPAALAEVFRESGARVPAVRARTSGERPTARGGKRRAAALPAERAAALEEGRRRALAALIKRHGTGKGSLAEAIKFVCRLLGTEKQLVEELFSLSPGADLVIHHLMDMEFAYGDSPAYAFARQIGRMRSLARWAGGRILGFVAFDPFRPDSFHLVRNALERGFRGVKFYPPNGYRPVGNRGRLVTGDDPRIIDARNLELFQLCVRLDVPILAHCTPEGMERIPGVTGKFSNPDHWRAVLGRKRHRDLRLCLGHAGGAEGWCDPPARGWGRFFRTYAGKVVRLCLDFPRVYCDFGHLGEVLDDRLRDHVRHWLSRVVAEFPDFARKLLYGSDFPMIMPPGGFEGYLGAMEDLFAGSPLAEHRERFFHANAVEFLDLKGFLARQGAELTSEQDERLDHAMGRAGARAAPVPPRVRGPSLAARAETVPAAAAPDPGLSADRRADCLVLGAGMAGMTAAWYLTHPEGGGFGDDRDVFSVLVLEAAGRIGGRMYSLREGFGDAVELGAELIHRPREDQGSDGFQLWQEIDRHNLQERPMKKLVASRIFSTRWSSAPRAGLRTGCDAAGDAQFDAGLDVLRRIPDFNQNFDISAAQFIRNCGVSIPESLAAEVANYVLSGTVPGELDALSAAGLKFDDVKGQEFSCEEFHVNGGFDQLPKRLGKDVPIRLGEVVRTVRRFPDGPRKGVEVVTAAGRTYFGRTAIATFSVGVLASGDVTFEPALPAGKRRALDLLAMGRISKVLLRFRPDRRFWGADTSTLSVPGHRKAGRSYFIPYYGMAQAPPVLAALITRSDAKVLDDVMAGHHEVGPDHPEAGIRQAVEKYIDERILDDLNRIFGEVLEFADVERYRAVSWWNNPLTRGGTAYLKFAPGTETRAMGEVRAALASAAETEPLFWAGEAAAVGTNPWSVHGAHRSGLTAAKAVRRYL